MAAEGEEINLSFSFGSLDILENKLKPDTPKKDTFTIDENVETSIAMDPAELEKEIVNQPKEDNLLEVSEKEINGVAKTDETLRTPKSVSEAFESPSRYSTNAHSAVSSMITPCCNIATSVATIDHNYIRNLLFKYALEMKSNDIRNSNEEHHQTISHSKNEHIRRALAMSPAQGFGVYPRVDSG
eukprot:CAMPEP_0171467826 /NCGR_PEP_ID=MMETSP0945-20130129/10228_1 /TAXON_ID=109269 /ORGANISM="Vaucheria litorea, Strain CCMP2940" /LENGTH=184 /DNA_ID=CAMNT_0011996469 /DNA_START=6 /DNA_END=557 /DNA_ORIENTATION=-